MAERGRATVQAKVIAPDAGSVLPENPLSENALLLEPCEDGVRFSLRATPRGRRNAIEGTRAGALLVSIAAVPEDGAANAAIIALLAKALGLPKSAVEIRHGTAARDKTIWLPLAPKTLLERLAPFKLPQK